MFENLKKSKQLDHLCRNRACVNPEHLEQVDRKENILRGEGAAAINARKTHCKYGHEYTPENLRNSKKGYKICKVCARAKDRVREKKRWLQKKAQLA